MDVGCDKRPHNNLCTSPVCQPQSRGFRCCVMIYPIWNTGLGYGFDDWLPFPHQVVIIQCGCLGPAPRDSFSLSQRESKTPHHNRSNTRSLTNRSRSSKAQTKPITAMEPMSAIINIAPLSQDQHMTILTSSRSARAKAQLMQPSRYRMQHSLDTASCSIWISGSPSWLMSKD